MRLFPVGREERQINGAHWCGKSFIFTIKEKWQGSKVLISNTESYPSPSLTVQHHSVIVISADVRLRTHGKKWRGGWFAGFLSLAQGPVLNMWDRKVWIALLFIYFMKQSAEVFHVPVKITHNRLHPTIHKFVFDNIRKCHCTLMTDPAQGAQLMCLVFMLIMKNSHDYMRVFAGTASLSRLWKNCLKTGNKQEAVVT